MTSYERFDVALVPFPFIDSGAAKPRPVLVISGRDFNAAHGASVLAMITTAAGSHWPSDVPIADLASAGLKRASFLRLKLFTLENLLITRRIGALAVPDRRKAAKALAACLGSPGKAGS